MPIPEPEIDSRQIEGLVPSSRSVRLPSGARGPGALAMNPWKNFRNEFKALMEEEELLRRQGVLRDLCHAHVRYGEPGEPNYWVESIATESLQLRFELLANQAGIALGWQSGASPQQYFIRHLFLDLRANKSRHIDLYSDRAANINHLFEALATYCALLELQSLEKSVMPRENASEAMTEPEPRRGYRTEVRQWMAREGVRTVDIAAKRLCISRSALKSIMSKRGKRRYGSAVLTRILASIGDKSE